MSSDKSMAKILKIDHQIKHKREVNPVRSCKCNIIMESDAGKGVAGVK